METNYRVSGKYVRPQGMPYNPGAWLKGPRVTRESLKVTSGPRGCLVTVGRDLRIQRVTIEPGGEVSPV